MDKANWIERILSYFATSKVATTETIRTTTQAPSTGRRERASMRAAMAERTTSPSASQTVG